MTPIVQRFELEEDAKSILWECQISEPCPGYPVQHEIARIIFAEGVRYWITYIAAVKELSGKDRDEWIKILSDATIAQ